MEEVRNIIKNIISIIYYRAIYNILKIFPIKKNRIIFNSFGGKFYSCNPKYIYKELLKQNKNFDFIWVLECDYSKYKELDNAKVVKKNSLRTLYYYATSKYWVINYQLDYRLKPKKNSIYIQTWHGTPLKNIGLDIENCEEWEKLNIKNDAKNWDVFISNSSEFEYIYIKAFAINKNIIMNIGLPRNDLLIDKDKNTELIQDVRKKLNLDKRKVILYAPTFRREDKDVINLKLDLDKLYKELSKEYILLVKAHPNFKLNISNQYSEFILDVTNYIDIQELYLVTDILITDYSSVFCDFVITEKPMIFYPYDYNQYIATSRKLYFEYKDIVPGPIVYSTEEIIECCKSIDKVKENYESKIKFIKNKFNGDCSELSTKTLLNIFEQK